MDDMWSTDELGTFVPTTTCGTPIETALDFGWEGEERRRVRSRFANSKCRRDRVDR